VTIVHALKTNFFLLALLLTGGQMSEKFTDHDTIRLGDSALRQHQ